MRNGVLLFMAISLLSLSASADSWYGTCVVVQDNSRICSEPQPRTADFSQVCDLFAEQLGAHSWQARFASSLDYLRHLMPNYCDEVRDGVNGAFYACKISTYCPQTAETQDRHLASKVYATSEEAAIGACLEKEKWTYQNELKRRSLEGCFVQIATENLPSR